MINNQDESYKELYSKTFKNVFKDGCKNIQKLIITVLYCHCMWTYLIKSIFSNAVTEFNLSSRVNIWWDTGMFKGKKYSGGSPICTSPPPTSASNSKWGLTHCAGNQHTGGGGGLGCPQGGRDFLDDKKWTLARLCQIGLVSQFQNSYYCVFN